MKNFKPILQAIKHLDFDALEQLLDDDKSYMEVPKRLFLDTLKKELKALGKAFKGYDEILTGTCGKCNKGCRAYSFYAKDYQSLNLFFEMKGDEIQDIYLCSDIKDVKKNESLLDIYFDFYEEDKVNFSPNLNYHTYKQKAEQAVDDFKALSKSSLVSIEELHYWRLKYKKMVSAFGVNDPFSNRKYKAFLEFDDISSGVYHLLGFYDKTDYAIEAMKEYHNLDPSNEKGIVNWLLTTNTHFLYFIEDNSPNWQNTRLFKLNLKFGPEIWVDCSSCIEAFKFANFYDTLEHQLIEKYKPSQEDSNTHDGIIYSLVSHLKIHGKYLDILPG